MTKVTCCAMLRHQAKAGEPLDDADDQRVDRAGEDHLHGQRERFLALVCGRPRRDRTSAATRTAEITMRLAPSILFIRAQMSATTVATQIVRMTKSAPALVAVCDST